MQKVGNAGRYQLQLVVIFAITWFVSGVVMMSNGFMFMENDFDCTGVELSDNSSCKDYVCQLTGD